MNNGNDFCIKNLIGLHILILRVYIYYIIYKNLLNLYLSYQIFIGKCVLKLFLEGSFIIIIRME